MIDTRMKSSFIKATFLFALVLTIASYLIITNRMEMLTFEKYQEVSTTMKNELKVLIQEKKEAVLYVTYALSYDSEVEKALLDHNSSLLQLSDFSKDLAKYTSMKNAWFQVVDAQGYSFYRSWTSKRGDDLKKVRVDIAKMIKRPRVSRTISTGKFDLTFKAMVPIYHEKKFIGFIETIAKVNSIAKKLEEKDILTAFVVDKSYKKQLTNSFTNTFINDYYIANEDVDSALFEYIKKEGIESFINNKMFYIDQTNNRLITLYHLPDILGQEMSYVFLAYNLNKLSFEQFIRYRDRFILFFIIIFISGTGLFYYLYVKRYERFISKVNENLEKSVQDKTETLHHLAHHDPLTGLPNRILFLDRLEQNIKHAKRKKKSVNVLFLDLDRFKEVNDSFGHEVGDKLLKEVTSRLLATVREVDTIARLGGDEFVMILEDMDTSSIVVVAEKLIDIMQMPFNIDNKELYVTFSIGVSRFPEDGRNSDVLIRNADTAMYKAKESGKNTYQFYNSEMTEATLERMNLENNLRRAIDKKEFQAYFQPKVNATTYKIVGMEGLIRWHHPSLGLISPVKFIPLAEELGLIIAIDMWMLENCLTTLKQWQEEDIYTGVLSLNLSIKQLENKDFVTELDALIHELEVSPESLDFEITEGQIMKDPESAINTLNAIKDLGISISIDDFGTGYSSLSYLKRLPIDTLKIDRSFVSELPYDEDDVAIVGSIIALAKSLNFDIIAEGVETQEQRDFLVQNGCTHFQGYFYSKALPADAYKEYLLLHKG